MFVGTLAPPNPCVTSVVANPTLVVCGVIHNPSRERLTGGTLLVQANPDARPVLLEFAVPPNPCLTYEVRAAAAADFGTGATVRLPAVQAVFTFESGDIISVSATPGPPDGPGNRLVDRGHPPNPCLVSFSGVASE